MKRRQFIGTLATLPALGAALNAQEGPPVQDPVERMTAPPWPTIALNHLGFRPRAGEKVLVVRALATPLPTEFTLRDVSERPFRFSRPLNKVNSDFGPCLVADFTELERTGLYQITVGPEHSVQFAIEDDVWGRTVPKAVGTTVTSAAASKYPTFIPPAISMTPAAATTANMSTKWAAGTMPAIYASGWM